MLIELQPGIQVDPRTILHVSSREKFVIVYQSGGECIKLKCDSEAAALKLVDDIAAKVNAACGRSPTAFSKPAPETR